MLSSIHPLGERARRNRWSTTVTAFAVGSITAAAAVGGALGAAGASVLPDPRGRTLVVLGVGAALAAVLDTAGVRAPGWHRQVNERWIQAYRGWVYGAGFGFQLGTGLMTYVVTWGVWFVLVAEFASATPWSGAAIGVAFGAGRTVPVVAGRWIDRPSRLTSFTHAMQRWAAPAFRLVAFAVAAAGVTAVVIGAA